MTIKFTRMIRHLGNVDIGVVFEYILIYQYIIIYFILICLRHLFNIQQSLVKITEKVNVSDFFAW